MPYCTYIWTVFNFWHFRTDPILQNNPHLLRLKQGNILRVSVRFERWREFFLNVIKPGIICCKMCCEMLGYELKRWSSILGRVVGIFLPIATSRSALRRSQSPQSVKAVGARRRPSPPPKQDEPFLNLGRMTGYLDPQFLSINSGICWNTTQIFSSILLLTHNSWWPYHLVRHYRTFAVETASLSNLGTNQTSSHAEYKNLWFFKSTFHRCNIPR
jgi:hypothetical protein